MSINSPTSPTTCPRTPLAHLLRSWAGIALVAAPVALLGACNTGTGSGSTAMVGLAGEELAKPDGSGTFFNDFNQGGNASAVRIVALFWGRLVDVHDVDALGNPSPLPVFEDFVINETIQTDGQKWDLETNPVTQQTRLIIRRTKGAPETVPGAGTFDDLLEEASDDLAPILPKSDDPGTLPPFSFIARNAALVIQFDDLLQDNAAAQLTLPEDVKLLTDYPPNLPFLNKRMFFDPNHGGIGAGAFHSTRVIVDMTVSEAEAAAVGSGVVGLNSLGLPPSLSSDITNQSNVSVRIPTVANFGVGQFSILRNLSGAGLTTSNNGPVDPTVATIDVVRAMRSGNPEDANNGFLLDLNAPELLGGWQITVDNATDDPAGAAGVDFLVDITFTTPCRAQPLVDNILQLASGFFEVTVDGSLPDGSGLVQNVSVRSLSGTIGSASDLLGGGLFQRTYDSTIFAGSLQGCWLGFAPLPGIFPASVVNPSSQVILRFSEPMDPLTVAPFDTFMMSRTDVNLEPTDIVVADMIPSGDVKEFTLSPLLPLDHMPGSPATRYYINLDGGPGGITDLAGNAPVDLPAQIFFDLDPAAPQVSNGGMVMRFSALDEIVFPPSAAGQPDVRGQFLYDFGRGVLKPRPVIRSSHVADANQAVVGLMTPFAPGVQTPLSPLGSRMMTVWRYCDFGFSTEDESNQNLDVEGINWSPVGGNVVSDFYPEFEMTLAHAIRLPDEDVSTTSLLPEKPQSGLRFSSFANNVLNDPLSPQKVVHGKGLGYVVNPLNLFVSATGTFLMPYPLNTLSNDPADHTLYTWRDTQILSEGGQGGSGIDLGIMVTAGLATDTGLIANQNQVPSIGLPLLMEFKCYPSESSVGLNAFNISLAITSSQLPAFRVFSTGGLNTTSVLVTKDPDIETSPSGGFNPSSVPPGATTPPNDPVFYIGQLDVISRVSRLHTIWLDTNDLSPDYLDPKIEPSPTDQPNGTQVILEFRGATAIGGQSSESGNGWAFDADRIGPYGNVRGDDGMGVADYLGDLTDITYIGDPIDDTWKPDIDNVDGAQFVQIRATFLGDTTTLLNAELSAIGLAYETD